MEQESLLISEQCFAASASSDGKTHNDGILCLSGQKKKI